MRIIMIVSCLLFVFFLSEKNQQLLKIENEIYELYSNNFKEYLNVNDKYMMFIECEKLMLYFNDKGYSVTVKEENGKIDFGVKYKCIKEKEKVYSFYVVANYENK